MSLYQNVVQTTSEKMRVNANKKKYNTALLHFNRKNNYTLSIFMGLKYSILQRRDTLPGLKTSYLFSLVAFVPVHNFG